VDLTTRRVACGRTAAGDVATVIRGRGGALPGKAILVLADNGCVAFNYMSYDDYKRALQELRRTGIALKTVLPFAVRPGDAVVIDDQEYILLAPVTESGPAVGPIEPEESAILGYLARRVH
jgi:hypothetical protein